MKTATIGNVIEFKVGDLGVTGVVEKVLDNSVIVDLSNHDNKLDVQKTVVNHKRYKVVK